jgi:hypothetical protein
MQRRLAQLRRNPRQPERRVRLFLGRRARQLAERRDVGRRAGRAQQRRPERRRLRDDDLDGNPLDRDRDGAIALTLDHGDERRRRVEPLQRVR